VRGAALSLKSAGAAATVELNGAIADQLRRYLRERRGETAYIGDDYAALIRRDDVDAVIVTSYTSAHADHVELALQGRDGRGHAFWRSDKGLRRYRAETADLLEQVGLEDKAGVAAGSLGYGQKRALELALALALSPRLLLLDEPTAGMGAEDVSRTIELIRRVREDRTVVLVEHNMKVVGDLTDKVTVLQFGTILAEGPYDEVRADPKVITAYLGESVA